MEFEQSDQFLGC